MNKTLVKCKIVVSGNTLTAYFWKKTFWKFGWWCPIGCSSGGERDGIDQYINDVSVSKLIFDNLISLSGRSKYFKP